MKNQNHPEFDEGFEKESDEIDRYFKRKGIDGKFKTYSEFHEAVSPLNWKWSIIDEIDKEETGLARFCNRKEMDDILLFEIVEYCDKKSKELASQRKYKSAYEISEFAREVEADIIKRGNGYTENQLLSMAESHFPGDKKFSKKIANLYKHED